jgi:hypothetical protein
VLTKRAVFGLAVLAHLAVLYWPREPSVTTTLPVDKVVHVTVFGGLLLVGLWAGLPLWPLAGVIALHAPASELVQHYLLPGRDGDLFDALADLTGVAAVVAMTVVHRSRRAVSDPG